LFSRVLIPFVAGVTQIIDYMAIVDKLKCPEGFHRLVRRVESVRGSMPLKLICKPSFDFARKPHIAIKNLHGTPKIKTIVTNT
jgi:hypothetical protein